MCPTTGSPSDAPRTQPGPAPGAPPADIEPRVREIGREIFRLAEQERESIWEKDYWIGKALDLTLRNPSFKTRLFQFVDVLPALRTGRQIGEHVQAYFAQDDAGGLPVPHWLRGLVGGAGLLSHWTAARLGAIMRRNILALAERFILAETPQAALDGLARLREAGCLATVDLLGEKVVSEGEAQAFQRRYLELIDTLGAAWQAVPQDGARDGAQRPNISVKLSTLCARLRAIDPEGSVAAAKDRLRPVLQRARAQGVFVNLDMEAFESKAITLRVFTELVAEPGLADWDHFGLVLQAYLTESLDDVQRMIAWCRGQGRRFTVRLVRGAYWDMETVLAVQRGWPSPVFREKWETDASFEACLRLLLVHHRDVRLALGSHNVRSIALTLALAEAMDVPPQALEFQMLYGMGDPIKKALLAMGHPVRVYAPVGNLLEGMAYLVRRLLENTSNESFLRHRFAEGRDAELLLQPPTKPAKNPTVDERATQGGRPAPAGPTFSNASLLDFNRPEHRRGVAEALEALARRLPLQAGPRIGGRAIATGRTLAIADPAQTESLLGRLEMAREEDADHAVRTARAAAAGWAETPPGERSDILRRAARIMGERRFPLTALMVREVGKTWGEADAEVVEAIDFLNFYAARMERLAGPRLTQTLPGELNHALHQPRGVAVVIAPWNFPLAISTGMTSAALVTGNTVIYKPAETSSFTGRAMADILYEAGVPPAVLTYLPGEGESVGRRLVAHPGVDLIAFTGSLEVGLGIVEAAGRTQPDQAGIKRVIAEMGGKNAIIVDDDADLDEAVRGIVQSAFGYGGQKCSACSRLIVLETVRERLTERLAAAVRDLRVGVPSDPATDLGPLIDSNAQERVRRYVALGERDGTVLARGADPPQHGWYAAPVVLGGLAPDSPLAQEEIFGPLLVVLPARDFDHALELANGTRFALTGGVYSRNPLHLEQARRKFRVGNLYLNRNITGAIVERQPFGGFALSGVGSKAGGRDYLLQFMESRTITENTLRQGFAPEGVPP